MVDLSGRLDMIVRDYIEPGQYFVINRGRQYGKTTTLVAISRLLKDRYLGFRLSLEGRDGYFESEWTFCEGMRQDLLEVAEAQCPECAEVWKCETPQTLPMKDFVRRVKSFCKQSPKPVVVTIDEVDKASDYKIFRDFLGSLRDMYIARSSDGTPTFHSVILAGVHDIRNLKKKIRPDEQATYNSPWNIAVPFTVDMSFSPADITGMLDDYEADNHTGMDTKAIAERLYYYTSGYPFMVSALCQMLDRNKSDTDNTWTISGLDNAVRDFMYSDNTLFDDLVKNIDANPGFAELTKQILLRGLSPAYTPGNYAMDLGLMYSIFKVENHFIKIANIIYETKITNYFMSLDETSVLCGKYTQERKDYFQNGVLNMRYLMERFNAFMKAEYREKDADFLERQGRLIFLSFLKGVINGSGNYAVEPETRNAMRMDVAVFYGGREYIIELKIWHGEKKNEDAVEQLVGYLKSRSLTEGYLLSFVPNKKGMVEGKAESHEVEQGGCRIYEQLVACRA
jgi:hypothetical protein